MTEHFKNICEQNMDIHKTRRGLWETRADNHGLAMRQDGL